MSFTIQRLLPNHEDSACRVLVESFQPDPVLTYLTEGSPPEPILECVFRAVLRYCQPFGHLYGVWTPSGELAGVAGWIPPGSPLEDWVAWVRAGFYRLLWLVHPRLWGRWLHLLTIIEPLPEPAWSLQVLAVSPSFQRQGLGGLLLEPVLQQATQAGIPCRLETSTKSAVRFYGRHGFEIIHCHSLSPSGLNYWQLQTSVSKVSKGSPIANSKAPQPDEFVNA